MYQRDRQDASVFVATSRLFGWGARSTLYSFLSRDRLRDDEGNVSTITDQTGISADQRWRTRGFQIVYGYRFERNHTFIPDTLDDPVPFDIVANLAKLSSAVIFDRRDDPINARKGTFSAISFDYAARRLGSDVSNRKILAQQFVFVPVGRLVLASRVLAGYAFGKDPLQFADRFRAGGATSVRGYSEDGLGPRDPNDPGLPGIGDRLLVLNQEVRFPIYRWANGVVFADAGNVFAGGETASWGELKVGVGVGLRFDTPVGLIRGDVGFPQSTLGPGRSTKTRWYFGFGHIF
jgi:outer membrane protein insertion porin family